MSVGRTYGQVPGECDGKIAFDDVRLAERAARRKRWRHVYKCSLCGKYHVGGRSAGPPKNFRRPPQVVRIW